MARYPEHSRVCWVWAIHNILTLLGVVSKYYTPTAFDNVCHRSTRGSNPCVGCPFCRT